MDEQKLITYLKSLVHLEPDKNWLLSGRDNLAKYMKGTLPSQPSWGRERFIFLRNMKFAAGAIALVLLLAMGTGSALASQESLPGDTLFPVKLFTEEVEKFLAQDEAKKLELSIKFADRRLKEIIMLSANSQAGNGNEEEIEKNLRRFRVEIEEGENFLAKIDVKEKKDKRTLTLVLKFEEGLGKHQEILAWLEEALPESAKEAIRLAREASERGEAVSFKISLKIEGSKEEEEDEDEDEEKPAQGIERLSGKIGAASQKVIEVEQHINRVEERKGEAFVAPAKKKLEEAKTLLAGLKSFLEGTSSPTETELEEAFRKAQEVIRIAEDAKRLLREDNRGHHGKQKIEVRVENGKAEVKIEIGENKLEIVLDTISREEIVAKIIELTGLTRGEVDAIMKFQIKEEELDKEEANEENEDNSEEEVGDGEENGQDEINNEEDEGAEELEGGEEEDDGENNENGNGGSNSTSNGGSGNGGGRGHN